MRLFRRRKPQEPTKKITYLKTIRAMLLVRVTDEFGIPLRYVSADAFLAHDGERYIFIPRYLPFVNLELLDKEAKAEEHKIFDDPECPADFDEMLNFIRKKKSYCISVYDYPKHLQNTN